MKRNIQSLCRAINRQLIIKLFFPLLSLLLFSFRPGEGTGRSKAPMTRKEVKVDNQFQRVNIYGDISIILTNEPAGRFMLEGNEKDLKKILYSVTNNELTINACKKNFFRDITIYLPATTLRSLQVNGNGNISSTGAIQPEALHILLNGDIDLKIYNKGKLNIDTQDDYELFWESRSLETRK